MRVSVVIAARDEAAAIAQVVVGCLAIAEVCEVVVVDDGSHDDTAAVAEAAGARVLVCRPGAGKGAAVRRGAATATGDVLVLLDGDGQDPPADITPLLVAIAEGADLAIGSRFRGRFEPGAITRIDALGNRALSWVFAQLFGAALTDTMAGFKAIRRSMFDALPLQARRFDIEAELLGRAVQAGACIVEVPVTRRPRVAGASRLRRITDGLRIVRCMLRVAASPGESATPVH